MRTPSHLVGHSVPVDSPEHPEIARSFALGAPGRVGYEVHFFGDVFPLAPREQLIVASPDPALPALVLARPVGGGDDVVLFDGGRHGYDAMFVDEHDLDDLSAREASHRLEIDGATTFAITVTVYDNIDWDEEEDDFRDDDGVVRLITGEAIDGDRLRADGYDAIAVEVTDAAGLQTTVVNEELA